MFGGCFDVSHNNGPIQWELVPKTYRLVFVKATQGARFTDPRFIANREGASDAGMMVVPYHFLNGEPGDVQARHFADTAGLLRGDTCMLDWEGDPPPPIECLEAMIDSLRITTSRDPLIYHGIYTLSSRKVNSCPWAVPKYGPRPQTKLKWLFWQNTPRGHVPGLIGNVDHDWFNGSEEQLELWFDGAKLPAELKSDPPGEPL